MVKEKMNLKMKLQVFTSSKPRSMIFVVLICSTTILAIFFLNALKPPFSLGIFTSSTVYAKLSEVFMAYFF